MLEVVPKLNKISFKNKLLLSYILLISIPLIISGILIYKQFLVSFRENSSTMVNQRLNQEVNSINETLLAVEKVGFQLASNDALALFLNDTYLPTSMDSYEAMKNKIIPLFTWAKNTTTVVKNINVLTFNGSISEIEMFNHAPRFESEIWFQDMREKTSLGIPYWETYHLQRMYRSFSSINATPSPIYSLFCTVAPVYKANTTYLELEVSSKLLFGSLNLSPVGKSGFFTVLSPEGGLLYGPDNSLVNSLVHDAGFLSNLKESGGEENFTLDGKNHMIYYQKIQKLDAYVVGIVPTIEITEFFNNTKNNILLTIGITFLFLLVLAYYLGNLLTKKIKKITRAFRKFQEGNFDTRISVKGSDELDKLGLDFNTMASSIHELINKVYKAEIAQKQAELAALQAQINPHFIYNTLESLKMLAELHDEDEISDGLTALGNLMRQNTYTENHQIDIGTELENLLDYVKIQNIIHNNKISLLCRVQEEVRQYRILNLILQPIVENCIIHGFNEKREGILLSIYGEKTDGSIYLTLHDNGIGIAPEKLKELNALLHHQAEAAPSQSHNKGVGLMNVHRRIQLYFGPEYGVNVESIANEGTTITVKIPSLLGDS